MFTFSGNYSFQIFTSSIFPNWYGWKRSLGRNGKKI